MMKKVSFFLLSVSLFVFFTAQAKAEEKIIDFASAMHVELNGSAVIEETITVNAEHVKIRRGLYRDLPDTAAEPVKFISLYMDNRQHPHFTENLNGILRINFGDDNFISPGIHTYRLTYSIGNIVKDFPEYDEVYWNITGNDWDFPIEHASFFISLPDEVVVKDELVSMYTGKKGSKASEAERTSPDFFETIRQLSRGEGFTVAVPFEKGIVQSHKKSNIPAVASLNKKSLIVVIAALIFFAFIAAYYLLTWLRVGRDPDDTIVTEFTPPAGISPAFMRCLWKRGTDRKMFATALVSLAMKNKITITEEKELFTKTCTLTLKDPDTYGLPPEEQYLLNALFGPSQKQFVINRSNWMRLSSYIRNVEKLFEFRMPEYIASNKKYITYAAVLLVLFQLLFIPLGAMATVFIFLNVHYSIFILAFVGLPKNKFVKALSFILLNAFYSVFFISTGSAAGTAFIIIEGCFLLLFWTFLIYTNIINNLTEQGREVFRHIRGFHRYMTIAEKHRVALSIPIDDAKIFADYLPYAFAFDMENKWMKRFEKVLSRVSMDQYTNNIGGVSAITSGALLSSINSSIPSSSGGSSGSGSGGGGSSGGGSGGGGRRRALIWRKDQRCCMRKPEKTFLSPIP